MTDKKWFLIDAKDKVVGRLATRIATILIGKNKSNFRPGADNGDFVVVVNSDSLKFTGNKVDHKFYYRNTGYPGGLRSTKAGDLLKDNSPEVLIKAVKGVLPKNKWQNKLLTRLRVYSSTIHPHTAQKLESLEV